MKNNTAVLHKQCGKNATSEVMSMQLKRFSSIAGVLCAAGLVLLLTPIRALAIGGCSDSPEEPTVALGLLGVTLAAAPYLKARFRRK